MYQVARAGLSFPSLSTTHPDAPFRLGHSLMDRLSRDGAATQQYRALVLSTYPSRHVGIHYSKERWTCRKAQMSLLSAEGSQG